MGMYSYDETIFNDFICPEELNKELAIDSIILECAELETKYPHPVYFRKAVQIWSKKEAPIWKKLWDTTQFEYNPIENYDRTEEGLDTDTNSHKEHIKNETGEQSSREQETSTTENILGESNGTAHSTNKSVNISEEMVKHDTTDTDTFNELHTTNHSGTDVTITKHDGKDTVNHQTAGFDSASLVSTQSDTTTYGSSQSSNMTHGEMIEDKHTGTVEHGASGSDTTSTNGSVDNTADGTDNIKTTENKTGKVAGTESVKNNSNADTETTSNDETVINHHLRTRGNIGVTTTQEMIQQERDIVQFDIYEHIVNSFKLNFCLLVY